MSMNNYTVFKIPSTPAPKVPMPNIPMSSVPNPNVMLKKISNTYCGCENGSMAANVGFPKSPVFEAYNKALERYNTEVEQSGGKSLAELNKIGESRNLPDYSEMIDKWLAKQEQYFDHVDKTYHYTDGKDPTVINGVKNFTEVFVSMVETNGPMDIKQENRWKDAFNVPYPDYFIYHGQVMDAATLGNVTYSYIGSKYYSDFFTLSGGAAVQTKRRDIKDLPFLYLLPNWGDMPEDKEAIELGIKWRKEGFPDEK